MIKCPEHGAMLSYGKHGDITIYRCEQVWGTHLETWLHSNGKFVEVKPHTYLKSKEGIKIKQQLES